MVCPFPLTSGCSQLNYMKFRCMWCKKEFEYDVDSKKALYRELQSFEFHAHSTHGISPEMIPLFYEAWIARRETIDSQK